MPDVPAELQPALEHLLLAVADDKLVLGHRNSDWTGLGPTLEEDIAFSALAQDSIAHASALFELVAGLRGGDDPDRIAFDRSMEDFRCAQLLELPDDFGYAMALARAFFFTHFDILRLGRMAGSSWKPLADLAARLAAEEQVHVDHVNDWIVRLGTGTQESHDRMQEAINRLAPVATTPFEPFDGLKGLVDAGIYPGSDFTMYDEWLRQINMVLTRARLEAEITVGEPDDKGGRRGVHSEHLKPLVDEMTEVYRLEPGAAW